MTCAKCGGPIDQRDHYAEVIGWEKPGRGAGGKSGSSLILRRKTGSLMCSPCALRLKHVGSPQGQDSLWSD